ncbi:MAG TPA: helix-turn-helix domain-containing protein [Polyangiaceae bacterium]|nr:helix-turn-helix domain-containing protein [Polyangiaceae bacterium]
MLPTPERRRIDWRVICNESPSELQLSTPTLPARQLAALTAEALGDPSPETADRILRHAIDFARSTLQIERCGIFLLDSENQWMTGTWGTDSKRRTVDEHSLIYDFGALDREVFERARAGFPWTVYENCPLINFEDDEVGVVSRGWVACTAIVGPQGPLGILFNDTALSHTPVDEAQQWRVVMLCSILANALWRCRTFLLPSAPSRFEARPGIVRSVTRLLTRDPTLSCDAMAKQLNVSSRRLARMFKHEAKSSIVDYRNELRLAAFLERVDSQGGNLLQAARDAGFGSYAQFHRVFRARFGRAPSEYLLERRMPDSNVINSTLTSHEASAHFAANEGMLTAKAVGQSSVTTVEPGE